MIDWLYKWLPIIFGCHCREDRSFYWHGKKFPICARCTGELGGILIGAVSCFFLRPSLKTAIILMVPMVADGLIQSLSHYESTNPKRFITGLLFGYGFFMVFAVTTIMAFKYGFNLGIELLKS